MVNFFYAYTELPTSEYVIVRAQTMLGRMIRNNHVLLQFMSLKQMRDGVLYAALQCLGVVLF